MQEDIKYSSASVPFASSGSTHPSSSSTSSRKRIGNVFLLLAQRETSPRAVHHAKKLWSKQNRSEADSVGFRCETTDSLGSTYQTIDAQQDLFSWAESKSLHNWSAKYCPLLPPPRSTIAAAFSPDGKTLASTHGDHTVKIIDCQTGKCLKVLSGHRRTPWVVRFHPMCSDILASGSLDHEVRLWDAKTSDCIGSRDFYRPIASIAFHAKGELLAVASGHKLFIWNYNKRGEASVPAIILKTRRSLRAVHFHPHGAPYLLTAEVNNIDAPDSPLTRATSSGYSNCPPAVLFANINSSCCPHLQTNLSSACLFWPAILMDDGRICLLPGDWAGASANGQHRAGPSTRHQMTSDLENQHDRFATPMDVCEGEPLGSNNIMEDVVPSASSTGIDVNNAREQSTPNLEGSTSAGNFERSNISENVQLSSLHSNGMAMPVTVGHSRPDAHDALPTSSSTTSGSMGIPMILRHLEGGHRYFGPFGDPPSWELPFLQGWLMAQNHANWLSFTAHHNNNILRDLSFGSGGGSGNLSSELPYTCTFEHLGALLSTSAAVGSSRGGGRRHTSRSHPVASVSGVGGSLGTQNDEGEAQAVSLGIGPELATSLLSGGAAELPCTVKLRIWHHDIKNPCALLDAAACRLQISHAVLCSEMGAHFSPCGRFVVACVACMLAQTEGEQGSQLPMQYDSTGPGTSPTRHPLPSHRVIYELRVYSLEEATFGTILASRAIRAAHCLTSIQFSPTSEHILLAYGRRHNSLLRSVVMDGETAIPIYTILEVYRVSDMELVGVLPSAEDEVNVACFHPSAGGGVVYGTKEGKLRILQNSGPRNVGGGGLNLFIEENMLEIQRCALEG